MHKLMNMKVKVILEKESEQQMWWEGGENKWAAENITRVILNFLEFWFTRQTNEV